MLKNKCSVCRWLFDETSVQIHRRLKKNEDPICSSCQRIARAEKAAEKRTIRKSRIVDKENLTTCKDGLQVQLEEAKKKYGRVSTSFIQRKFNVTFEEAEKLSEKVNG